MRNQDYSGEYEVIIADNGSSDNTVSIARDFGLRVVSYPQRKSVFYARAVGAGAARGDIIVQADADTIYPRDWLRRIADQFARHPEVVAVTGGLSTGTPSGGPRWSRKAPTRHRAKAA